MRRLIDVASPPARRAVGALGLRRLDTPAAHPGAAVVVRADSGRLVFTPADAVTREDEWRVPAALYLHRFSRPVPVELVLAPWSVARSELRLDLRCRRSLHIPPRYFAVAHAVMDELRDAVESSMEKLAPATLSGSDDDPRWGASRC